jgi:hypothetical protein
LPDTAVITIVVVGGRGAAAMSNPSGIVKRIPLIKFPNRKAGQTQGIVLRLLVLCVFFFPLTSLLRYRINLVSEFLRT